jgi:single-strand DNA-binding protein
VTTKRPSGRNKAGERTFETDWTTVEAWDTLAERCAQSLHKGSRVQIIGSLHTRSWEDRESGQKRFKTSMRADEVLLLDARECEQDEAEAVEEAVEELPF